MDSVDHRVQGTGYRVARVSALGGVQLINAQHDNEVLTRAQTWQPLFGLFGLGLMPFDR